MFEIQVCCTYMRTTVTTLTHDGFASIPMLVGPSAFSGEPQSEVHSYPAYGVGKKPFLGTGLVGAHATTDGFCTLHDTYLDIWGV